MGYITIKIKIDKVSDAQATAKLEALRTKVGQITDASILLMRFTGDDSTTP